MTNLISQNAFRVVEGRPVTSSRIVAEYFGKKHSDVVRAIQAIITQKPDLQASRNFAQWSEEVEIGSGAKRTVVCFWMDRKGFAILAMGFTGAKALDFKCAFYDEFERMEKQLHPAVECPAKDQLPPPMLTESQAYQIMSEVAKRARKDGSKYQTIYRALKARYQVTKYTHIPAASFDDAITFIRSVELRAPEVPQQEPRKGLWLSDHQAKRLATFLYELYDLFAPSFQAHYDLLVKVKSPDAPRFYEAFHSFSAILLAKYLADNGYGKEAIA